MLIEETKKWLIIQIKPNCYNIANRNLERQGFETFVPKMRVTIKTNNKFLTKETYVFPGYIFVYFNPNEPFWKKINNTYGVLRVLTFNKKPEEISNDMILQIKNRYNLKKFESKSENLEKGDFIKMYTGPFADFFAKVESIEKNNRIWFLLEYEGKMQRLKFKNDGKVRYKKL